MGLVTRCVCREVPLGVVARAAQALRAAGSPVSIHALSDLTLAGTGCGTCRPYMARAALTGSAAIPVMTPTQCSIWLARLEASNQPPRWDL